MNSAKRYSGLESKGQGEENMLPTSSDPADSSRPVQTDIVGISTDDCNESEIHDDPLKKLGNKKQPTGKRPLVSLLLLFVFFFRWKMCVHLLIIENKCYVS